MEFEILPFTSPQETKMVKVDLYYTGRLEKGTLDESKFTIDPLFENVVASNIVFFLFFIRLSSNHLALNMGK